MDNRKPTIYNCGNSDEETFLDASKGSWPKDKFCMALDNEFDTDETSYEISADLNNHDSSGGSGFGHLGLAYNMLDTSNYEGIYLRHAE